MLKNSIIRFQPHFVTNISGFFSFSTLRMNYDSTKKRKVEERKSDRLVWVDLEMTGLNADTDHILEMACLITDAELNLIAESPDLIIHQPDSVLDSMGEWCQQHHGQSGLTASVRNSKISLSEAEKTMVSFVKEHTIKGSSPLAGNSVHADKQFLVKYMPDFMEQLHYRIVDVSTVKELCRYVADILKMCMKKFDAENIFFDKQYAAGIKRWYPEKYNNAPKKKGSHRALDDIKESIGELKYYRQAIFQGDGCS